MKFIGQEADFDNSSDLTGVLIANLGTPDSADFKGLRRYLGEFLMDPRVIELPSVLRAILVKGIIINTRSFKSAEAYKEVWTDSGSPLLINTKSMADKVATRLGDKFAVAVGMRYGNPSVSSALNELQSQGVRKLIVLPMYPQYSGSTNGSAFDAVSNHFRKQRWVPSINFISDYYRHPQYINSVAASIREHWAEHGRKQKLVFSFHGVPKKYISKGDPYYQQCIYSGIAIAEKLELQEHEWMTVFQSRFGLEEWLQPYCDKTLEKLPEQGVKSIDILCPGFSADCLETLEEIEGENQEIFRKAGGEDYAYIPCLNDRDDHAKLIEDLIRTHAQGLI